MLDFLAGAALVLVVVAWVRMRKSASTPPPGSTSENVPEVPVAEAATDVQNVLDTLPIGVVVFDSDGRETSRNKAARNFTETVHGDVLLDGVVERLTKSAMVGDRGEETVQLVGPPKKVVHVSVLPFEDGGAISVLEDLTERWLVDQVRTDFVANVSHELKTPVGAISVLADTLEAETEDELVKRLAGRMVIESERMSRTIDDLLELSRIEMGGEMVTAPVNLAEVVDQAIDRAAGQAEKRGVSLDKSVGAGDAVVVGDFFQLVSAIGNLVENAVKYSNEGGNVTVKVLPAPDSVEIEVSDQGIGIPAEALDRVFERFFRVDRSHSRATGGTGLGLSIVRRVVTNHGGEVNVASREGEGSVFTVRLPRRTGMPAGSMETDHESPGTNE